MTLRIFQTGQTGRTGRRLAALLLLGATTCNPGIRSGVEDPDGGFNEEDRCTEGIDSDQDSLTNADECALGTDSFVSDTDKDGVADGTEVRYPKACVSADMKAQRRPPPACTGDADCQLGESCKGLDPKKADSDGDGVPDGMEDTNYDGSVDIGRGESDPRLFDTDGDGKSDGMGGLEICRPAGLAPVTQANVPMGSIQLGHDPKWGNAKPVNGTNSRGALVLDDPATGVAGVVFTLQSQGDVRAEAMRLESAAAAALGGGVTSVLTGQSLTTHEMFPAVTSTYRVVQNSNASALRDKLVMPLAGAAAPGGGAAGAAAEFLMDVTTVRRTGAPGRTDFVVTIMPRADYENPAKVTAIRSGDLVNTTGVAEAGRMIGSGCQVYRADKASVADFLWTVDTSGSMSDDQERLGNTATKFFQRLTAAGVDFRVGVLNAGSQTPNIDAPGFTFIDGKDPNGPKELCSQVTTGQCPMVAESKVPYPMLGGLEEPVAAAILGHDTFQKRAMMGEMNLNRRFRDGAKVVAFLVTDEPGSNDFSRYFSTSKDPQTGNAWGAAYNAATLTNIVGYFKRNQILTFGLVPVSATPCAPTPAVADLPRCVIEGNGGAAIKIETALAAEVDAAMSKIVDAVAGATSQFRLDRSPITSTIKVRVRGMDVPRSRADGFDYDAASRSVIFYGNTFRPQKGDEVVVSYRVWEGSLG
jgi:hypothetical protein